MNQASATPADYSPLRLVRVAAGLTQEELGKVADVTQAMISAAETGATRLGPETVLRIADHPVIRSAMIREGVTVEDLIRGERS